MATKAKVRAKKPRHVDRLDVPPGSVVSYSAGKICGVIGVSERQFRNMVDAGQFPKPDYHIGRLMRWWNSTVDAWQLAQGAKGGDDGQRQQA